MPIQVRREVASNARRGAIDWEGRKIESLELW